MPAQKNVGMKADVAGLKARSTRVKVVKQKFGIGARRAMKKIEAIIQPFKLDEVKEALKAIGIDGMTITEVRGHGRQKGHKEVYRGQEYNVDLLPKVKIELVVSGDRAEEAIKTLTAAARTGKIGDGKLFVYDVAEAIRIRNDDRGDAAL